MTYKYQVLTQDDIDHFLDKGYVILHDCFTQEQASWALKDVWVRLGLNPNDKTNWPERVHMPDQRAFKVSEFAPKAWKGICDLLGGDEFITEKGREWRDGFIVNLGSPEFKDNGPQEGLSLTNWHTDGDFFLHFLDSPEQALLVIPIFSDEIKQNGGATFIAPDSISGAAKFLADHPEGVLPGPDFNYQELVNNCKEFVELTGKVGDTVLLHPLMAHSASRNSLRAPRFITNPPVSTSKPFQFSKPIEKLNLVEQKTLRALGKTSYNFQIKSERRTFPGGRHELWQQVRKEERERLKQYGAYSFFANADTVA
jgi:hypothetical protein